jgi:hypothetical protein
MGAKKIFLLLGATTCIALFAACDDGDDDDSDGGRTPELNEASIACVDRINGFRDTLGLAPLGRWRSAESCADDQAETASGHPDSPHYAFQQCDEYAQNECPGWASYDDIVQGCLQAMWNEGPGEPYEDHGHYINMSNPDYTEVACGFYTTPDGYVWAVQDFR